MTAVAIKVNKGLETAGLSWFVPLVNLVSGENPRAQLADLARNVGMPLLGIAAFLLVWSAIAANVRTSIGQVPGPTEVWHAAGTLWADYRAQHQKAVDFYARQKVMKAQWNAKWPNQPFVDRPFAGKPTYLDQIFTSLKTVFTGFLIAAAIAVPVGILCGLSPTFFAAVSPFIAIFKPVSPLAWLPIVIILVASLYHPAHPMFEKAFISSAITVALCSLWPALINTAVGVASIDKDHMNVAKVLRLGPWKKLTKIVIPSALPLMFTGLRLSLGVGWMVLIAAEMLAQNPGLGKFIWDMYQNGSSDTLALIMVAVFTIGIVGFILDRIMVALQKLVSYNSAVAVH